MRKRGRDKLCTNAIVECSRCAGSQSRRGRVDQIWPDQSKRASAGSVMHCSLPLFTMFESVN